MQAVGESYSFCNSLNLSRKKSFLGEPTQTKPLVSKNGLALIGHQSWILRVLFYPSSTEAGLCDLPFYRGKFLVAIWSTSTSTGPGGTAAGACFVLSPEMDLCMCTFHWDHEAMKPCSNLSKCQSTGET